MVHVLGVQLRDGQLVRTALTAFYGIGHATSRRICARLQIHNAAKMRELTPTQLTNLGAYLSSPSTAPPMPTFPLAAPDFRPPLRSPPMPTPSAEDDARWDPLRTLKIETDLKREVRENIAHQRMIGSYVGRRHAMGLPVRGQNTQGNAKTARKLNKIERYA